MKERELDRVNNRLYYLQLQFESGNVYQSDISLTICHFRTQRKKVKTALSDKAMELLAVEHTLCILTGIDCKGEHVIPEPYDAELEDAQIENALHDIDPALFVDVIGAPDIPLEPLRRDFMERGIYG